MPDTVVIETQYLPSIEFFCAIRPFQKVEIEVHEHFQKQTYRNRCYILGANNIQCLTIPVVKSNSKTIVKDLKIDNRQRWNAGHWRSIKSAYGKAPFFEYFSADFEEIYAKPPDYLIDFNSKLLTLCLRLLNSPKEVSRTSNFQSHLESGFQDVRSTITPKKPYIERHYYSPHTYIQVFGKNFVPNLSVIDLLMNEGPNALNIISSSSHQIEH